MKYLLSLLRAERGSAAASVAFTMFVALTLTAVTAAVLASLTVTTATSNQTSANTNTLLLQERYLSSLAKGTAAPGEVCSGPFCAHVGGTADSNGLRVLTLQNTASSTTEIRTLRPVTGTMISGFDSLGRPVWTSRGDLTPYRFSSLITGHNHTCALDTSKAAWCWGDNDLGQLGDGTTTDRNAPVKVQTPALFSSLIAGGLNTTCGLTDAGKVLCWGDNSSGQLGTGATDVGVNATAPVSPLGDHTFSSLALGPGTVCGIDDAKKAWCWGANPGNATPDAAPEPAEVAGGHEFTTLTIGTATACGLDAGGKAWCWAASSSGRTGNEPAPAPGTPVEVTGGRTYTRILVAPASDPAAPSVACAIDSAAAAWCWGPNGQGQLGAGNTTDSLVPVLVTGGRRFASLAMTSATTCGIDDSAHLWCWGANTDGQVGNGTTTDAKDPVAIDPATTYKSVAPGGNFFCGLTAAGQTKCWGNNAGGQASPGSTTRVTTPAVVSGLGTTKAIGAGDAHVCAADTRSGVNCWGRNDSGQSGAGSPSLTSTPGTGVRKELAPTIFDGFVKGGK